MAAVMAHGERTGAVILAEGIEDRACLDQHSRSVRSWARAGCSDALDRWSGRRYRSLRSPTLARSHRCLRLRSPSSTATTDSESAARLSCWGCHATSRVRAFNSRRHPSCSAHSKPRTDSRLRPPLGTRGWQHYSGALIARDLGDDGPDADRRYEFVVTHDRDLVLDASRSLMARITSN
jgi:hypothetical protein